MPPRKKTSPEAAEVAKLSVAQAFYQWVTLKRQSDQLTKRQKLLRDRMCGDLETEGYQDDKGSLYLDLDEPVEGYAGLKYERRIGKSLNLDRANDLVAAKGLTERVIVMVPTLDQEELLKAHYDGLVTQEELDSIMDVSETFAFVPVKE
jgi:hypothetical protein